MVEDSGFQIRPEIHPLSIIRAVWKHKIFAIIFALVGIGTVAAVVYSLPAVYSSSTLIQVEAQRLPDRFVQDTIQTPLAGRLAQLEAQILSYNELLNIIETFGLYADERESLTDEDLVLRMRESIEVKPHRSFTRSSTTAAFTVSFEGTEPELVQQVANQLGQLFINKNTDNRKTQATGTAEFLKRQLEEAKRELEVQERLLAEYRTRNNGQLPENQSALLSQLSTLQLQLRSLQDDEARLYEKRLRLESDVTQARAMIANLQRLSEQGAAVATTEDGAATPASGQRVSLSRAEGQLVQRYQRTQAELAALLTRLTESHPDVRRKQSEVDRLENQVRQVLEARKKMAAGGSDTANVPTTSGSSRDFAMATQLGKDIAQQQGVIEAKRKQIEFAEQQAAQLAAQRQRTLGKIESINARLQGIPLRDAEMTAVLRDYETKRQAYDQMLAKLIDADQAKEMELLEKSERFATIERARVPIKPVSPNRPLILGAGAIVCLALALILAYALELKKNVLLGEWELPAEAMVLGRVPVIQQGPAVAGPFGSIGGGTSRSRFWWLNPLAWRPAIAVPMLLLGVVAVVILTGIRMGWVPL